MIPGWEGRDAEGWAEVLGVPRLELHDELDSTNTRLRALATEVPGGALPFTTVVAHVQRAGRGREGRVWRSEGGAGLWISVLLPMPPGGPPGVATLAVGVAVAEAVERLGGEAPTRPRGERASDPAADLRSSPSGRVGLKWPNDVMAVSRNGRVMGKLAGILCEVAAAGKGGGVAGIVAGIGVNLRPTAGSDPDPGSFPAADLETLLRRGVRPHELAHPLVQALRRLANPPPARLEGGLRAAWEARDLLVGTRVQVTPGPRGVVRGVGDDGALLVEAEVEAEGEVESHAEADLEREGERELARVIPVRAGRVRWT